MIFAEKKIQLRSKSLILYELPDYYNSSNRSNKFNRLQQIKEIQKTTYSGKLTPSTRKRLTKAIDILCQTIKPKRIFNEVIGKKVMHRLSFITLTVSQHRNLTAREVYNKGFKHFLQWMRRTLKVNTYVWKCEVQNRGQIHYHITTPTFIHFQLVRDKWNNIQRQNGWLTDYFKLKGHNDPNSTDIHEVKKVRNLSSYLLKEFCKSIQNPQTDGKVWDCSVNLKKWKYYTINETTEKNDILSDMIDTKKFDVICLDNCIVLKTKKNSTTEILDLKQLKEYEEFLEMIRSYRIK